MCKHDARTNPADTITDTDKLSPILLIFVTPFVRHGGDLGTSILDKTSVLWVDNSKNVEASVCDFDVCLVNTSIVS